MDRRTKREKRDLRRDLEFYLDYYKDITTRSERMKRAVDHEIERIVEALKQI